ncbi:MAG: 4Fe-4S binding protein [Nitrososphaerales archaeon]
MKKLPKWNEMEEGFITRILSESINKTGTWRTFKPIIDQSRCTKCGWCIVYCPEPCIYYESKKDSKILIDYDFCKGCGICAEECPVKCINMVLEE